MGSFLSRKEEDAAIAAAEEHYEFYAWGGIVVGALSAAAVVFNGGELYTIFATPALRRTTSMLLVAGLCLPPVPPLPPCVLSLSHPLPLASPLHQAWRCLTFCSRCTRVAELSIKRVSGT